MGLNKESTKLIKAMESAIRAFEGAVEAGIDSGDIALEVAKRYGTDVTLGWALAFMGLTTHQFFLGKMTKAEFDKIMGKLPALLDDINLLAGNKLKEKLN